MVELESPRLWWDLSPRYLVAENRLPVAAPVWDETLEAPHFVVALTDRIGDAFNSIYFLSNLRRLYPGSRITYISQAFGDASFLRRVIGQYADAVLALENLSESAFKALEPTVVFDLNPAPHLFPFYPALPASRVGHHERCDVIVPQPPRNWKANDHLNLLRYFGKEVVFEYPPPRLPAKADRRAQLPCPDGPYVAVCFEATARSWMMSEEVMQGVVRYLLDATDLHVCVLGSNINEHGFAFDAASPRFHNLTSELSLYQAVCVIAHAEFVVSVDTGLMHAASYVGRPLLAVFTCGDPQKNGPQGQRGPTLVGRVRVDPPTGARDKRDYKQSGIERAYLRLDHVAEGIEALKCAPATAVSERFSEVLEIGN
jgi:ADP-heptose:LPS heptosyltransferase